MTWDDYWQLQWMHLIVASKVAVGVVAIGLSLIFFRMMLVRPPK